MLAEHHPEEWIADGRREAGHRQSPARLGCPVLRPIDRSRGKGSHMGTEPPLRVLLIVIGSTLRAEEMDRPLGYYLKQRVEQALSEAIADGQSDLEGYAVRVVADFRWIHDDPLQNLPTISLGGPGVNALAHRWLEDVPVSLAFNDRYFIQMDPDLTEARVSIWGMDNSTTQIAVSVFIERFLPRFLERCAKISAHFILPEGDSEIGPGNDLDETDDD